MTDNKSKMLKRLLSLTERYFLPLLLGAVVMNLIFDTYFSYRLFVRLATMGFVCYESALFWVFEKIKKKKIVRFFIYMGISLVVLVATMYLIGTGWMETGVSFMEWFYVDASEIGSVFLYDIVLFMGLGYFIISILYYFTVYRFRIFGVLLVTVFPFVIYGKRSENMSTLSVTIMMTVFLAMMVHQSLVNDEGQQNSKRNLIANRSYVIGVALFVTFVGAVTMVLPKPEHKSQLETGEGIFRYNITTSKTAFDDLNDVSSPRFGADSTGEVLFRVSSSEDVDIIYMRRQSFDYFRNEQWVLRDEFEKWYGVDDYTDSEVNSPLAVYRLMKTLAETHRYEHLGLTEDLFGKYREYSTKPWLNLSGPEYGPTYIPAPLMASVEQLSYCYRTPHGEVYYENGFSSRYGGLGVSYAYVAESAREYAHVRDLPFTWAGFERIMNEAMNNNDVTPEQYSNILRIRELYTEKGGVSERIDELAHEITKDCRTDYEKCTALVDYFEKSGYIYDIDYIPDDESIEYFLFESKTGVCSSYATAMALMARALDIPARYVEGFSVYERDEDGMYVVRDSHAHAFVEAYIPGAGWVTFDPTVPAYMDTAENNNGNITQAVRTFVDYLSRIILFLGVVFVLVFVIFLDRIIEFFFRVKMKFIKSPDRKTLALYSRILRLLETSSDKSAHIRGMTPQEILVLSKTRGAEITRETELFEKVCFGGYKPAAVEFEAAYSCYKQSWKALAGKNKKRRDKKVQSAG